MVLPVPVPACTTRCARRRSRRRPPAPSAADRAAARPRQPAGRRRRARRAPAVRPGWSRRRVDGAVAQRALGAARGRLASATAASSSASPMSGHRPCVHRHAGADDLPEHEVRQAPLARRAHEHVDRRAGRAGRGARRSPLAIGAPGGEGAAGGVGQLGAAAVVERDRQRQAGVAGRRRLGACGSSAGCTGRARVGLVERAGPSSGRGRSSR